MADEPLTLTLPADQSAALRAAVESGEYVSVESALADALDAWSRREEEQAEEFAWVKARVLASIDDPRPSLSEREVDEHMKGVFANARKRRDEAA